MILFKFSAPIKPVSANQAVRHGRNGSYKSDAYKAFWREINLALSKKESVIIPHAQLKMIIHFTLPRDEFFTQKGVIAKKHDLDNLQKYTIDAVAKYLKFNDAIITELTSIKIPGDRWHIDIELREF
jgi:Holliday junction resolvase RusA-like endonuclease